MTQQGVINFGPNQESGYEELAGAQSLAMNVVIDGKGTVSKRPGIATLSEFPSSVVDSDGIDSIYHSYDGDYFAIGGSTTSRKIYKVFGGNAVEISSNATSRLTGNARPIIAETESFIIIAGGFKLQKIKKSDFTCSRLGGNPPLSSHISANSSRLLSNDVTVDRTKVRYSGISIGTTDTSGHESWDVTGNAEDAGFFTAEARPDKVVALYENTNEVFVFGQDNVQVFVCCTEQC